MNFRKDINGLRAFAVIAVVIFHFSPALLPGGFAGVDVFFVISGFLMTKIIFLGLENNKFKFISFLTSRVNRILPALTVVCALLLIFGWFYLPPSLYKELGIHVAGSASFSSNILYWLQMGYFSPSANEKWLLHTWSLSAEWQFYLIYPLLLLFLSTKVTFKNLKFVVLILALISFVFSLYLTSTYPNASYYLLPSRAWEMLAGGLVFLFPMDLKSSTRKGLYTCGLISIIVTCVLVGEDFLWPGWYTLIPVIGTCIILYSENNDSIVLNNLFTQKIGSWSYSIYLWHWPVVVFFNYLNWITYSDVFLGIALSILFGAISFQVIEKSSLFNNQSSNWLSLLKNPAIYGSLFITLFGGFIFLSNGVDSRKFLSNSDILKEIKMPNRSNGYCFYDFNGSHLFKNYKSKSVNCLLGGTKAPKTLLFGDSFAGHYEPFLDELFKEQGSSFDSVTTNWCHPSLSANFMGPSNHPSLAQCIKNRKYVSENLDSYNTMIISGMWLNIYNKEYFEEVLSFIEFAANKGLNIVILPSPKLYNTNVARRFEASLFSNLFDFNIDSYGSSDDLEVIKLHAALEELSKSYLNILFVSRSDLFNQSGVFNTDKGTVPYSLDSAHISTVGSKNILSTFRSSDTYRKLLRIISSHHSD